MLKREGCAHGAAVAAVEARLVDGAVLGQVTVGQRAVRRVAVADVHEVPPIAAGLRPPRVQQRPLHHHSGAGWQRVEGEGAGEVGGEEEAGKGAVVDEAAVGLREQQQVAHRPVQPGRVCHPLSKREG